MYEIDPYLNLNQPQPLRLCQSLDSGLKYTLSCLSTHAFSPICLPAIAFGQIDMLHSTMIIAEYFRHVLCQSIMSLY